MHETLDQLQLSILGALLKAPERIGEAAAALPVEDLENSVLQAVYKVMRRLHEEGRTVDRLTLLHELGEEYAPALEELEGHDSSDLQGYIRMQREQRLLSRLQNAALGVAYAQTLDEAESQAAALAALAADRPGKRRYTMEELLGGFFDRLGNEKEVEYLPWGFEELDKNLYARLGNFIVLGGYPSAGKTLLSIQLALKMAQKYRVGYFSFETDERTLAERVLAHAAHVPLGVIKRGKLSETDVRRLTNAAQWLCKLPIDWLPCAGADVSWIRAEALNRRHQVIFVDYLQQVSSRGRDRYEQVTAISQDLAMTARSTNIAVIALAQLSRPEKTGKGQRLKRPNMSSFRESGQIEQDADIAFLLYPEDPNDNHSARILSVGKNKEGERPQITLDFDGQTQTFRYHKKTSGANKQISMEELPDDGEPLPF